MIVCPLLVGGEVIGTLNLARMGEQEAHFSQDEFELVQLFAGQASIALRNAEAHGAVVTKAEHDALTGLRNHGAFQLELTTLVEHERPFTLADARPRRVQGLQRHPRPPRGRRPARPGRGGDDASRSAPRTASTATAATSSRSSCPAYRATEAREVGERIRTSVARLTDTFGPLVTVSVGVAHVPQGRVDEGRPGDGRRPRAVPRQAARPRARHRRRPDPRPVPRRGRPDDAQAPRAPRAPRAAPRDRRARGGPRRREARLPVPARGRPGGAAPSSSPGSGRGCSRRTTATGCRTGKGVGWHVARTGQPIVVDDYAEYADRAPDLPAADFGAVLAVPLTSGGEVLGNIGLASGDASRPFSQREVEAVVRFAPAGVDRAGQRAAVRAGPDRGPRSGPTPRSTTP